jgi:glycosyltransferase involved in cell wall biosynthesis
MISVCLACYNGEKYIQQQIESILKQLRDGDELLISDDGSSDQTVKIIESINDPKIVLYKKSFKNHILNFEFVLGQAKGDYIFLSDQDDVWLDNKVSVVLDLLKNNDLVMSDCYLVDSNLKIFRDSHFKSTPKAGFIRNFYKNIYTGCCMAFRKEVLDYALPFPKKINSHDMWIGMVCELFFKIAITPEKLIYFRRHGENFSSVKSNDTFVTHKSNSKFSEIIKSRIYFAYNLSKLGINKFLK